MLDFSLGCRILKGTPDQLLFCYVCHTSLFIIPKIQNWTHPTLESCQNRLVLPAVILCLLNIKPAAVCLFSDRIVEAKEQQSQQGSPATSNSRFSGRAS